MTVTCEDVMLPDLPTTRWSVPAVWRGSWAMVTTVTCEDENKQAVAKALKLVSGRALSWKAKGGAVNQNATVVGNIGPLFLLWHLHVDGGSDCWEVTSLFVVGAGPRDSKWHKPAQERHLDILFVSSLHASECLMWETQHRFPQQEQDHFILSGTSLRKDTRLPNASCRESSHL